MLTTIAITGGVACGKSFATQFLVSRFTEAGDKARQFNCDESVSNWLTDAVIREMLQKAIGTHIINHDGSVNRFSLRKEVFGNPVIRKRAEEILHPRVLESANFFLEDCLKNHVSFALVEVPLLYEASFPLKRDTDLLVGCSQKTQLKRLTTLRQLSEEIALQILDSQMPPLEKITKAQFVVWNDGCLESIQNQLSRFSKFIRSQVELSHDRRN